MDPFTHIISLGSDCRIAHNTRRFYNHGEGYPFDWWISPARSLCLYAATGFDPDALFDLRELEEVRSSTGGIASIRHRSFGMRLHHEFQRGNDAKFEVLPTWQGEIEARKLRHIYLIQKLRGLNAATSKILFMRGQAWGDTQDDLATLTRALDELLPLAQTRFLFVNYEVALPGGNLSMAVDDSKAADWKGDQQNWDDALKASGVIIENPTLKPYRGLSPEGERAGH